jgi:hypothetical protein
VIDRWIYTAFLCFGLNIDEQQQSGFRYDYSIYEVEYSRNLVFASGAVMDRLFNPPSKLAGTRIGGIDLDRPRVRAALAAALALAVASAGFTVAQFTVRVRAMSGQTPRTTASAKAPTTYANCAANSSS